MDIFIANIDFARILADYLSSRDFVKLILISKKFNNILSIVKNKYKKLYFNFICQREIYYPSIFSTYFEYHNKDTLSEFLVEETINNLMYNDNGRLYNNFHNKKIRKILYQLFPFYLIKPIQINNNDDSIEYYNVGSVIYYNDGVINKDGKWVNYDNGQYHLKYQLSIENIDYDNRYFDNILSEMRAYTLFELLHIFSIELKNKLITDKIVISPFEKTPCINYKIYRILYTQHLNIFYKDIEEIPILVDKNLIKFYDEISIL